MTDETFRGASVEIIRPDPELPHSEQPALVLAALTMLGEARGESTAGKKGVLWTIRNRRRIAEDYAKRKGGKAHPLFGNGSLASCVLAKWQFSCWNAGDPNVAFLSKIVNTRGDSLGKGMWAVAYALAHQVEAAEWKDDPTYGATHYCTIPLWGTSDTMAWYGAPCIAKGDTVETVTIGNHVFAKVK